MKRVLLALLGFVCTGISWGADRPVQLPTPAQTIYGPAIYVAVAGVHLGPLACFAPGTITKDSLAVILAGAVSVMRVLPCDAAENAEQCDRDRARIQWLASQDVAAFVAFTQSRKPFPWDPDIYAFCTSSVAAKTIIDSPDDVFDAGQLRGNGRCLDAMVLRVKWPNELGGDGGGGPAEGEIARGGGATPKDHRPGR